MQTEEEEAAAKAAAEEQAGSASVSAEVDDSSPQVEVVHRHQDPGKQELIAKLVDMAKDKGIDMKQGVSVEVRVKGSIDKKKVRCYGLHFDLKQVEHVPPLRRLNALHTSRLYLLWSPCSVATLRHPTEF